MCCISSGTIISEHVVKWLVPTTRRVIHTHLSNPQLVHFTNRIPTVYDTAIIVPE